MNKLPFLRVLSSFREGKETPPRGNDTPSGALRTPPAYRIASRPQARVHSRLSHAHTVCTPPPCPFPGLFVARFCRADVHCLERRTPRAYGPAHFLDHPLSTCERTRVDSLSPSKAEVIQGAMPTRAARFVALSRRAGG